MTAGKPIVSLASPAPLWVPMIQHDGPASRIIVEPGQFVHKGQLIGQAREPEPGALNVHAPLAGRVSRIVRVETARLTDVPAVEIVTDNTPTNKNGINSKSFTAPNIPHNAEALAGLADNAGLINFRHPTNSLGDEIRKAAAVGVSHIIINAPQSEPMLTADRQLLTESLDEVIKASIWVRDAVNAKRIWLATDRQDRQLLSRCRSAASGTPIRVIGLANKYPQSKPELLTYVIVGRETPYGNSTINAGVFVVEIAALSALFAAVLRGQPLIERVVTVTGSAAKRPGHYRIPLGTTFAGVLRQVGISGVVVRVVDGGPMTGRSVESLDIVVTKQTSAIMLIDRDTDRVPVPGPCIHCGWCQEDCPVGLDPQALLDTYERRALAEAARLYPHACVECGLCSYVCPAELPLAEAVVRLKGFVPLGAAAHVGEPGTNSASWSNSTPDAQ